MKNKYDEDLFANTTMTFGEHLEELRGALFRALLGLVVCFGIGLAVGKYVVHLILDPLEGALGSFYSTTSIEKYKAWAAVRENRGEPTPYTVEEIERRVLVDEMIFDIQYVDAKQVLDELKWARVTTLGDGTSFGLDSAAVSGQKNTSPVSQGQDGETTATDNSVAGKANSLLPVFLWHPIAEDGRIRAKSFSATETFTIWMKASLVVGAVLSSPWVFFQIWSFVAAGLYPHEKKYVYRFLPFSLGLFWLGAATAYLFVFEPVLNFLFSFNSWLGIDPDPRISEWLSFVLLLPIGFGISFQLPLVMLFLERIGVFDVHAYLSKWRISIMVIVIASALLTPADPYSMMYMAVPLTMLYFVGVLLCYWRPRNPNLWDQSREEKRKEEVGSRES